MHVCAAAACYTRFLQSNNVQYYIDFLIVAATAAAAAIIIYSRRSRNDPRGARIRCGGPSPRYIADPPRALQLGGLLARTKRSPPSFSRFSFSLSRVYLYILLRRSSDACCWSLRIVAHAGNCLFSRRFFLFKRHTRLCGTDVSFFFPLRGRAVLLPLRPDDGYI